MNDVEKNTGYHQVLKCGYVTVSEEYCNGINTQISKKKFYRMDMYSGRTIDVLDKSDLDDYFDGCYVKIVPDDDRGLIAIIITKMFMISILNHRWRKWNHWVAIQK